jgi:hypothetical protein
MVLTYLFQLQMVSTRNKRVPSRYRPSERNDGSESAGGAMVHSIRHARHDPTAVQPKQMKVLELQAMPHKRQQLLKLPQ